MRSDRIRLGEAPPVRRGLERSARWFPPHYSSTLVRQPDEGGATADIPEERLRRQFEVNVFGPVLLTQGIARRMAARHSGRIVFMSSVAGLTVDPFTGAYAGSKHAVEAFADALDQELAEFGVTVATINPGPFFTGFNDTMFETWREWRDNPADRLYDYSALAARAVRPRTGLRTDRAGPARRGPPLPASAPRRDGAARSATRSMRCATGSSTTGTARPSRSGPTTAAPERRSDPDRSTDARRPAVAIGSAGTAPAAGRDT